ncbi:hypothetical protein HK100_001548 [Physocladia obscura]|uniref:RNI-like protein n=1 Tax=Physocladia obscura TaxID=109957 RepID=A0AAD5T8C3_9FUNG|nr:hypothetical protein HK100_001548 [Physocladia obscura]
MDQDTLNSDHDVIQSSGQFVNSAATTQSSASSVPASILPLSSLLEGLSIFEEATIPSETFTERIDSTKTIKNDNGDTILIQETTLIAETGEVIQEITTTETHQIVTLKPVEIEVEEVELRLQETVMEEGDIDLVSLSNEIATNTGISALELANDGLTTEEVIMFAKAIEVNTTLEKLDIEGNDITEEGLLALCSAIRLNKSLREINIGTQQIIVSDEVEMELASAIEKNENNAAALVAQNAIIRNKAAYELWLHRKRTKTIFVPETTEVTTVKKDRRILKNSRSGDNFANFDNADEDSEISESESVYDHSIPRDLTISDESFVKDERIGFVENEYFANEKSTSERNLKTAFDNEKNSLGDAKPINFQEGSLADLVPPIEFGIVDTETASSSKELISTTNDILIKEITISQEPPKFLSNDEPMFASDGSAVEEPIIIESGSIFDVDEIPAERQTLIGLPSKEFLHDNNAPVIPSETSTEEPTVVESVLTSLSNLPEESTGIKLVVASAMEGEPTDKFIDASSNSETESEEIQVSSIRVSVVTISSTEEPTIVESAPLLIVETLQTEEPTIIIEKSVNKSNISRNNILAEPIIGSSEDDVVEEIPMSTIVETKIKTELKTSLSNLDLPNLAKNNGDTLSVHETTIFSEAGEEIKEIVTIETHQVVSTKPIQVEVEETVREVRETLLEGGDLDLVWLANEVASNADMTSLELINDGLTTEEIIIFTKALEINTVLEKINISGNEINYKGLLAICRVIRVNKTLREIIIGVQQIVINDDVELEIASAIESNE